MAGVIFLVVSAVAFVGLVIYIKKSDSVGSKDLMNELYDKGVSKKEVDEVDSGDGVASNDIEKSLEATGIEEDLDKEEEFEEYTYDSYKSDEEYLRIANLVKNIYYTIVCVVIMLLGILYIILFKI